MFGTTDSDGETDRSDMPAHDDSSEHGMLFDVLVNVVPIGILLFFVVLFLAYGSFPSDPAVTLIQVSLILIPAIVVTVVTYYAVTAVTRDEREGGAEIPPGYSRADAETLSNGSDE
jgi:hypothetical protein